MGVSNANKNLPVSNPSEAQAFRQPSFHVCRSSRFHSPHIHRRLWKRVLNQDNAGTNMATARTRSRGRQDNRLLRTLAQLN